MTSFEEDEIGTIIFTQIFLLPMYYLLIIASRHF